MTPSDVYLIQLSGICFLFGFLEFIALVTDQDFKYWSLGIMGFTAIAMGFLNYIVHAENRLVLPFAFLCFFNFFLILIWSFRVFYLYFRYWRKNKHNGKER